MENENKYYMNYYDVYLEKPFEIKHLSELEKSRLKHQLTKDIERETFILINVLAANPNYNYPENYKNGRELEYWLTNSIKYQKLKEVLNMIEDLEPEKKPETNKTEKLNITQKLIALSFFKDFDKMNFAGRNERQFLAALLNENPESIKKPAGKFNEIKTGTTTPKQAESFKATLTPIYQYFVNIGFMDFARQIEKRLKELERVINNS